MAKSEGTTTSFNTNDADKLIATVKDLRNPKSVKQAALNRIREIEAATGKTLYGAYNGVSRNPSEMARWEEETMGDCA